MKGKTLLVLVVAGAALAAVVYLNSRSDKSVSGGGPEMGYRPFAALPVNDISAVTIAGPEGEVLLRKGTVWEVASRFGYPADFGKVADLVRKISDVKIGRSFQADADAMARMRLTAPEKTDLPADQRGLRIIMRDADDKVLSEVIVGRARDAGTGHGGHYLLNVREKAVYLADQNLDFIARTPSGWLENKLLEARSMDVAAVTCLEKGDPGKPFYHLRRSEKGESPRFDPPLADKAADTGKVNSLFGALEGLTIEDVADPTAELTAAFKDAPVLEYHMYDGMVFRVTPGGALPDDPERLYLRVAVDYKAPPKMEKPGSEEKPEGEAAAEGKAAEPVVEKEEEKIDPAEVKARAAELHGRVGAWTYVIDKWRHDRFVAAADGLIKAE